MARRQTLDELKQHLAEHMISMAVSAHLYDEGMAWEAKRLATSIRTLLHEGNGKSLLAQLKVKDKFAWASTVPMGPAFQDPPGIRTNNTEYVTGNDPTEPSILSMDLDLSVVAGRPKMTVRWKPVFDITCHVLDFDEWWKGNVLAAGGTTYRRWDLIQGPANWDGGAHVTEMENKYARLGRSAGSMFAALGDEHLPQILVQENAVLAAVRTITFEIMATLDAQIATVLPISTAEVALRQGPEFEQYEIPYWLRQRLPTRYQT